MRIRSNVWFLAPAVALALSTAFAREPTQLVRPPHGVVGVQDAQLTPQFWVDKLGNDADRVLLDAAAIETANAKMRAQDPTIHDVALPASLPQAQVREWITDLSERPTRTLYDEQHKEIPAATLDGLVDALALDTIAADITPRYALVENRAA